MTEVYQSLASSIYLNLLITGKNQLLTALPCMEGIPKNMTVQQSVCSAKNSILLPIWIN